MNFEAITEYESSHPDESWEAKITYCKVCGDVMIVFPDKDVVCSCKNAVVESNVIGGKCGEMFDTFKGAVYTTHIGDEVLAFINKLPLEEFAKQFKYVYTSLYPKHVTIESSKGKTTKKNSKKLEKVIKSED